MKQSGLLKRQKSVMDVTQTATRDTYKQFMVDTLVSTLNDSDVMGHDVFGAKRMNNVIEAWMARFDYFLPALGKSDEADYYQEKLDRSLQKTFGKDGVQPFSERYEWLKQQKYR